MEVGGQNGRKGAWDVSGDSGFILFLDLDTGYMGVFTLCIFMELYTYYLGQLYRYTHAHIHICIFQEVHIHLILVIVIVRLYKVAINNKLVNIESLPLGEI